MLYLFTLYVDLPSNGFILNFTGGGAKDSEGLRNNFLKKENDMVIRMYAMYLKVMLNPCNECLIPI